MAERKRGKKLDVVRIEHGAQRHNVEVRFDRDNGDIFAELGGEELVAKTLDELKAKLKTKAAEMVRYEYKWFIRVKFACSVGHVRHSWGKDVEDLEEDDHVVGLDFAFQVVERSQKIKNDDVNYRGEEVYIRMQRDVDEVDGKLVPQGEPTADRFHGSSNEDDFIEFTEERYRKLLAIRDGMKELAVRLGRVVGTPSEKMARALDAMTPAFLALPASTAAPTPAGKKTKAK